MRDTACRRPPVLDEAQPPEVSSQGALPHATVWRGVAATGGDKAVQ